MKIRVVLSHIYSFSSIVVHLVWSQAFLFTNSLRGFKNKNTNGCIVNQKVAFAIFECFNTKAFDHVGQEKMASPDLLMSTLRLFIPIGAFYSQNHKQFRSLHFQSFVILPFPGSVLEEESAKRSHMQWNVDSYVFCNPFYHNIIEIKSLSCFTIIKKILFSLKIKVKLN